MKKLKKNKGILFWITGLSGSGKTTIAKKIKPEIAKFYGPTILISGDNLRKIFNFKKYSNNARYKNGLMFSKLCEFITNQKINFFVPLDFNKTEAPQQQSIITPEPEKFEERRINCSNGEYEIQLFVDDIFEENVSKIKQYNEEVTKAEAEYGLDTIDHEEYEDKYVKFIEMQEKIKQKRGYDRVELVIEEEDPEELLPETGGDKELYRTYKPMDTLYELSNED